MKSQWPAALLQTTLWDSALMRCNIAPTNRFISAVRIYDGLQSKRSLAYKTHAAVGTGDFKPVLCLQDFYHFL